MAEIQTYVFVHLDGRPIPAGRLTMVEQTRDSRAAFTYGERYLERHDRVALDPVQLPLPEPGERAEFVTQEGFALFNGIRDAAPDGWGRYLFYKADQDRWPTEAALLLASGEYRIGALAFGPTLDGPQRSGPWPQAAIPGEFVSLEQLAEASERAQEIERLDDNLRLLLAEAASLGGARPKAATRLDGRLAIAKFPARDDPFPECRVELATMRLAAQCGLNVPKLNFVEALGRDIYLIDRFDRSGNEDRRVPFVSGLTMLGAHESEITRYSYANLAASLRQYGSRVREDLAELFARMVFNVLVCNDDDHLRNHGFLWNGKGWNLSPLYDVVPKPQVGLERRLAIGVGPRGREASLANALAGSAQFGLDPLIAKDTVLRLAAQVAAQWRPSFAEAGLDPDTVERFATCFRQAQPEVHGLTG